MLLPKILLKKKIGQFLVLLGLSTTLLCLWTAQQEWDYHASDRHSSRKLRDSEQGEEYVVVNALLDEIRGVDEKNEDTKVTDPDLDDWHDPDATFYTPTFGSGSKRPCPLYPQETLMGRLAGMKDCISPEELIKTHPAVEKGGRVRPHNCTAAEKVAIIIPFRNRHTHLYMLLNNLIPLLQRQMVDGRFFVIEQTGTAIFNRAAMFNVGFLEAMKIDNYDCFIFHDVDLIPLNDRNLYRCDDHPIHFAVGMDKYKYKLPYKQYVGGVVGFSREQYIKINGNSNLYFGWGGEDDDLYERITNKKYEVARPYADVGKYDMVRHSHDKGNEDNCDRRKLLWTARERQDIEGLNTAKYHVERIRIRSHMTWIYADISTEEVLATAPEKTKRHMDLKPSDPHSSSCNFSRSAPIHV